jgi:histidine decarboxylase
MHPNPERRREMKKNNMGIDFGKLDRLADKVLEKKKSAMGYPINQNTSLDGFYKWYVEKQLYGVSMNNVGDPCRREKDSNYSMNTHEFEREVIDYFARLYGFKKKYWGFVTTSGTDGNNHGIYAGRKYLQLKSPLSTPVIYYSKEIHHSVKNLADVQNMMRCQIQAEPLGKMDIDDFRQQLDPSHPAIIVIAMGTTFTGAIDDLAAIRNVLKEKHKGSAYIHLDAALFGGFLPYLDGNAPRLVNRQIHEFDSIAVSGHKFFGFDEPMGIYISTRAAFENLNPNPIGYLDDTVPTITCSRSALAPLKFWWKIKSTSTAEFKKQAEAILGNAEYLLDRMKKAGIKAWKNPYSNIVFFKRPSNDIQKKYDLAPGKIEDLEGSLEVAHLVIMPHVGRELIDSFVQDMQTQFPKQGPV